jgi:hypothetical protein
MKSDGADVREDILYAKGILKEKNSVVRINLFDK